MRALDRIKSACSMEATPRSVALPNGDKFEFWMSPLTVAQRMKAQKMVGKDDPMAFSLQLLVNVARDENGQQMFNVGDLPDLRHALPASVVDEILLQVLQASDDEDEDEDLDPKASKRSSAKTTS